MEKTSVYLSTAERRHLAWLADATGRSQSALIREAIAAFRPVGVDDRDFAVAGVASGPVDDVAAIDEEELLEGFGT